MSFLIVGGLVPSGVEGVAFSQPIFGPPVNLGPKINTAFNQLDPFLAADGKKLFFSNGADIWFSEMTDTGWTNAKKLGPQINYSIFFQISPSVSPDGQKLYYVDAERNGTNWDIWVSTWDSNLSDWGTPENLGPPVNTPGVEFSARIAPDGRHLYFSSSYVQEGLFVTEWDGNSWSMPVYLGDNVSLMSADYPSVTADGRWLYFRAWPDGETVMASPWTDTGWGTAFNLASRFGRGISYPYITPSGDSLLFCGWERYFPGYGNWDIFVAERISTPVDDSNRVPPLPTTFELYPCYPNPFNSRTKIRFFVSKGLSGRVDVTIFNLLGVPVRQLVRKEAMNGPREVEWDGTDDNGKEMSSGVYFIRLKVGSEFVVKRATFLK
ncbi:MAG TPA: T9SS type A sorting domain-containing protein [candidate division Zixibacteria bacterium]|nr:T9SS type A sorting domain-containing protein [candidate division Zixibacteria bacterium]